MVDEMIPDRFRSDGKNEMHVSEGVMKAAGYTAEQIDQARKPEGHHDGSIVWFITRTMP